MDILNAAHRPWPLRWRQPGPPLSRLTERFRFGVRDGLSPEVDGLVLVRTLRVQHLAQAFRKVRDGKFARDVRCGVWRADLSQDGRDIDQHPRALLPTIGQDGPCAVHVTKEIGLDHPSEVLGRHVFKATNHGHHGIVDSRVKAPMRRHGSPRQFVHLWAMGTLEAHDHGLSPSYAPPITEAGPTPHQPHMKNATAFQSASRRVQLMECYAG